MDLAAATAHFHEHGYVVLPAYLSAEDLAPVQASLPQLFPTPEEFHSGADPERNARFLQGPFAGIDDFPYKAVEWSLLTVSEPIVSLAEALLGTDRIRLYEAHNWAKYGGEIEYGQNLHRDFGNHTFLTPSDDPAHGDVEMFFYVHDVPVEAGPTYVVSKQHTGHVPAWPSMITREAHPEVYEMELPAEGPAGTLLAYKSSTFHRGSAMTDPLGSRFVMKSSFRVISEPWLDRLELAGNLRGRWTHFVNAATPRQLELLGFPPPGHPYWTADTYAGTALRYPDADLSAFAPA